MISLRTKNQHRPWDTLVDTTGRIGVVVAFALSILSGVAGAAPQAATAPGLGAAASFSVLGKAGVTNTGNSVISGNVGADLLGAITGFGSATVGGSFVAAPAVNQAEADISTADLALTAQGPGASVGPNLTGLTLVPGVYSVGSALLPGVLTLNGAGVYIFLVSSDLTASGSVSLINGASPCNVFWHVTSAAHITGGAFVGTIIAGTAVTFGSGASLDGRALAKTANVTLINNHIFGPSCGPASSGGPQQPSYVDVSYPCSPDAKTVTVTVGMSAGVIVYGLGADITSATDTGTNKIVRVLPFGHYDWHAVPPAGHYLVAVSSGVVDAFLCPSSAPGATAAPTASATGVPVLIAVSGGDLMEGRALAGRQLLQGSLGFLGLGLVLVGIALWRKRG